MEDRYEIRGKIGQGGLGAVYRAYDSRMHREVAIKRITSSEDDSELMEESTRQLIKEAGALASLQHPHIVTVYDVGSDEDGPYVVMELISGKTLDEIVEGAPLMWQDFRELALQTQEALIAAQELQLIHRDIKPGNVMLTWLPSGKFQIKIVDFGLAMLTAKPSLPTLDETDSVFGSVFFMAPEQFERVHIDARADMYAMGCVYYHALTGIHPFNGETGAQVMAAHLQHKVTPLQDVRANLPLWVCDWIMWHINRQPEDRPESARDSLQVFLQNDKMQDPPMSTGTPATSGETPKRPRLIIPGSVVEKAPAAPVVAVPEKVTTDDPVKTQTAPQPLTPPDGFKPSVHTSPGIAPQESPPAIAVVPTPVPASPVKAATGGLISAKAAPVVGSPAVKQQIGTQPRTAATTPGSQITLGGAPVKKKSMDNSMKVTIAVVLGIAALLLGYYLLKQSGKNTQAKIYNAMIAEAAKPDASEVLVNASKLKLLLDTTISLSANEQRTTVYKALILAKATDATNVDLVIAEFATQRPMISDIRKALISQVIGQRKNPSTVPTLMAYAKSTDDTSAATAALKAVSNMADDSHFQQLLDFIQSSTNPSMRQAAEEAVVVIIKKSSNRAQLGSTLTTAYKSSTNEAARHSMLRLLGRTGDKSALDIVTQLLATNEIKEQIAALLALAAWGDESAFPVLMDFLSKTTDLSLRERAFDSTFKFITRTDLERDTSTRGNQWKALAAEAKLQMEQDKIVRELALNEKDEWVIPLVEKYVNESEYDRVIDLSERALDRLRERARLKAVDEGTAEPKKAQDE